MDKEKIENKLSGISYLLSIYEIDDEFYDQICKDINKDIDDIREELGLK